MKGQRLVPSHKEASACSALRIACSVSASVLALAAACPIAAQNATPPEPAIAQAGVEEIVVTAQKREQNLQDVPIAVTALTPNTLVVNRVQNVNDLTGLAPGLLARQNPGGVASPTFSMRGVFAIGSVASQDREIPIYLDGVYIGANRGALFELPDLERIEVLRGPQGTLFGRNSTGGAVSIVTRDPSGSFAARQELTVGNYQQLRTRTSIDLPRMGPFSAYVTYLHNERRGDIRNLGAGVQFDRTNPFTRIGIGTANRYLGSSNAENIFAAVKFDPTDNFKMVYKFDRSDQTITDQGRSLSALNPNSQSGIGQLILNFLANQPPGGGRFGPTGLVPSQRRPDAINNSWVEPGFTVTSGHSLTTTWRLADQISLKNITGYRRVRTYSTSSVGGLDGLELTPGAVPAYVEFVLPQSVPGFANLPLATQNVFRGLASNALNALTGSYFPFFDTANFSKQRQFSTETQVNYDSSFLTATAGVIYYYSRAKEGGLPGFSNQYRFQPFPAVPGQLPLGMINDFLATTRSYAAYVQGEFHITPELDFVGGVRVTRDKKKGFTETGGTFVGTRQDGDITGTTVVPFTFKVTKPTYSVGLNYTPAQNILVYGKYATGFVSGGATAGPVSGVFPFRPEILKSAEIGIKSDFFDRRVRANLAAFIADYHHQQGVISGANLVLNGQRAIDIGAAVIDNGTLKARGVEAEVSVVPMRGLSINGSIGYVHDKLKNPNPAAALGNPYKQIGVSPWVGSAGVQYETTPLFGEATGYFRLDANYQGRFRAIPFENVETIYPFAAPYEFNKSQVIVNGRLALRKIAAGRAEGEIGFWTKNLTNNRNSSYPLLFGDFAVNSNYVPARTYGIDVIFNFR